MNKTSKKYPPHGRTLDEVLIEENVFEQVVFAATKKVIAAQLAKAMEDQKITKTEMARRMHTSRASLNRLMDPDNLGVTLQMMEKAARVLGRHISIELV